MFCPMSLLVPFTILPICVTLHRRSRGMCMTEETGTWEGALATPLIQEREGRLFALETS